MKEARSVEGLAATTGVAFGTSGVRGLVEQMVPDICAAYTAAFLQVVESSSTSKRVAIGIDLRPSSPEIARACAWAIEAAGLEVDYCGALPTPALAYYAMQEGIAAVMVTGSHIPFDRNGIKFYREDGEITKEDERAISSAVIELPETLRLPDLPAVNPAAQQSYLDRYCRFFAEDMLAGLRIGFYQHSGVGRDLITELMSRLGAEVVPLARTNEFVPIDTEAVSEEDRARGKAWVEGHKFDALISTDGDADRPLLGDEHGNWLRGDVVGLLCSRYLKAEAVVTPVSSTTAIEESGAFKKVLRTRIGSPYVIDGMDKASKEGWSPVVGFEANGGFLLGNAVKRGDAVLAPLPTRDAVLPILALLALSRESRLPLSALVAELPQRFTASDRLQAFFQERSARVLERLQADPEPLRRMYGEIASRDLTDGLRYTFASGEIVHLRPSGNAPELRCYAEADQQTRAEALVAETLEFVRNCA